jgi:hypothetical protein
MVSQMRHSRRLKLRSRPKVGEARDTMASVRRDPRSSTLIRLDHCRHTAPTDLGECSCSSLSSPDF